MKPNVNNCVYWLTISLITGTPLFFYIFLPDVFALVINSTIFMELVYVTINYIAQL